MTDFSFFTTKVMHYCMTLLIYLLFKWYKDLAEHVKDIQIGKKKKN